MSRSDGNWTRFIHAVLKTKDGESYEAIPIQKGSRLRSIAEKKALIIIPEGKKDIKKGDMVYVRILDCSALGNMDILHVTGSHD